MKMPSHGNLLLLLDVCEMNALVINVFLWQKFSVCVCVCVCVWGGGGGVIPLLLLWIRFSRNIRDSFDKRRIIYTIIMM